MRTIGAILLFGSFAAALVFAFKQGEKKATKNPDKKHNSNLIDEAEAFHRAGIDDFRQGTNGVNVFLIVGSGRGTEAEIKVSVKGFCPVCLIRYDIDESKTGDGTVPAISASLRSLDGTVDFSGDASVFYTDKLEHGDLVKDEAVLRFITGIFSNPPNTSSQANNMAASANVHFDLPPGMSLNPTLVNGRQFLIQGMADMEISDENGNLTGPLGNDVFDESADGTSYTVIEDTTSIFVQGTGKYTLKVKAHDSGKFNLNLRTVHDSVVERLVRFADVSFSQACSAAQLIFNTNENKPKDLLSLDQDCNGDFETTLPPDSDFEGQPSRDNSPPIASIHLEGQQVKDNQYVGPVQVTIKAEDNSEGTGIAKIEYTLDDGVTVKEYTTPFTVTDIGSKTIRAKTTDNAGNISEEATVTVTIMPEIKLTEIIINNNDEFTNDKKIKVSLN